MKKNYLLFLLLFSHILFSQCQQFPQMLTDPMYNLTFFDKNHIVGMGGTTVLNTENEGEKWNLLPYPIDNRYYQLYDSEKINDTTAILVGFHGKILKTTDKGVTWDSQSLAFNGDEYLQSVDFVNDSVGYIFGDYKYFEPNYFSRIFYKTTNGGKKWKKVESNINSVFSDDVSAAQIKFLNEDIGFLYNRYYLYRTLDGGKNWKEVKGYSDFYNIGVINSLEALDDNTLVISLGGNIYTSKDLGQTFQNIPELQYPNNIYLSYKIVVKDRILYGLSNQNLLRYNFDTKTITQKPIVDINSKDYGYHTMFAIDVLDDDNIVLSFIASTGNSGKKVVKTNNGGQSWETILDVSASYGDNYKIVNDGQNMFMSKIGYPGTFDSSYLLYVSNDSGLSWKEIRKEYSYDSGPWVGDVRVISIKENYLGYGFTQTDIVNNLQTPPKYFFNESLDKGITWTKRQMNVPQNFNFSSNYITQIDENTLFYSNNYNGGAISFNKGVVWKQIKAPVIPNFSFYGMKYIKNDEIYTWGRYQSFPTVYDYSLYKTTNQGDSWEKVLTIPDNDGNDMGYVSEFTVFGSNYAFVSTGGKKFFKIDLTTREYSLFDGTIPGDPIYTNSLKILKDDFWYHPGNSNYYSDGTYYYSRDKGKTWKQQPCFICTGNVYLNSDTEEVVIAKSDFKMEKIHNYELNSAPKIFGNTEVDVNSNEEYFIAQDLFSETEWTLESGGIMTFEPSTKFYKIKINWKDEGDHIIKVRKVNSCASSPYYSLNVTVKPKLSINETDYQKGLVVSPNPFTSKIQISGLNKNETLKVNFYDASGKNVLTKSEGIIKENNYTLNNLGHLVKGIYFIEIIQGGKSTMKKILRE